MDVLNKFRKNSIKVHKPYKVGTAPLSPTARPSNTSLRPGQTSMTTLPVPIPAPGSPAPSQGEAYLPSPPPQQFYLYQMVQATPPTTPSSKTRTKQGPEPAPLPPVPSTPTTSTPVTKTTPRTVHEYYDQLSFQWREFDPEETVVGDGNDPFIVYFRYVSKSIGARRTPWLLPKHAKLIKIMQDCLPDFDWRTGEDLLVCVPVCSAYL
jgi:hypothetical protein